MFTLQQKRLLIFISIMSFFGLAGCWSSQELDDLSILSGLAIDKTDDQYNITAEVINPGQVAAQGGGAGATTRTPVSTYQETGDTLFETTRKMTEKVPKEIYFAHVRMIIISEDLAKEDGIKKILDFLSREHEFRTDFFFVIAKDTTAKSVLDIMTAMEKIPAEKMHLSLQDSQDRYGTTVAVTIDQLLKDLVNKGKHPILTGVQVLGDPEFGASRTNVEMIPSPTIVDFSGIAAFKQDRLVGWLNENESIGYNFITDGITDSAFDIPCPQDEKEKIVLELDQSKTELKGSTNKDQPTIDITIKTEGDVGEVMCGIDLMKEETFSQLEKRTEEKIKDLVSSSIEKAQTEFQSDIFGFGEVIHRNEPKAWKQIQKDWDQHFINTQVNTTVDFNIRRTGTIGNSFLKTLEED